jgi:hypothetical protein
MTPTRLVYYPEHQVIISSRYLVAIEDNLPTANPNALDKHHNDPPGPSFTCFKLDTPPYGIILLL